MIHILPDSIFEWFKNRNSSHNPIYLVGGAVRDQLLGIDSDDFDFITPSGAVDLARRLADDFSSAFYIMDKERGIARVLYSVNGKNLTLDFADFRGDTLDEDLHHRDFAINAMAREIADFEKLIDPLHGEDDLDERSIRVCSTVSFKEDPVRCLRAVRFSHQLDYRLEQETLSWLKEAVCELPLSSIERQRDELFLIFALNNPGNAIQNLLDLGILDGLLPELIPLVNYPQTAHHAHDAWTHTLAVVDYCAQILKWVSSDGEQRPENQFLINATEKMKPYRDFLWRYFSDENFKPRSLSNLFLFAALYHDVGKPLTRSETTDGIQFIDHDLAGARMAAIRARNLALSNREVEFVESVIRNHMLIHPMIKQENMDPRESAYRYYQTAGFAGVADCLFSLADLLSTYEKKMDPARWEAGVKMSCRLLDMWVNHYFDVVDPIPLLDGNAIKIVLGLDEGPTIGKLIAELKHAQAIGKIGTKEKAIEFMRSKWNSMEGGINGKS